MIAGIETGGTKIACGLVDQGDPSHAVEVRRFPTTTPEETLGRIAEFLDDADRRFGLTAIGIASFGPVNVDPSAPHHGRITATPKPGWADTDLLSRLPVTDRVPTAVVSDVSGAALGEQRYGAGRGFASVAYGTFGTGVGVGIVHDGRLLLGNGYPELGHLLVRRHPDDNFGGSCPFHGDCAEGLAAGPAVQARWGADSSNLPADVRDQAFGILGCYIAQVAAATGYATGVQRMVAAGGVLKAPGLLDVTRRALTRVIGGPGAGHGAALDDPEFLVAPALGDASGVLGAVAAAMDLLV